MIYSILLKLNCIVVPKSLQEILLEKAEFILQEINNYNPLLFRSIKTKLSFIFPPSQAEADKIDGAVTQGLANLTEN